MNASTVGRTLLTLALLAALAAQAQAGKFNKVLSIGDAAPAWSGIVGVDDQPHALADYADKKAIVLIFTCNHCPVAQACEERIMELTRDYQQRGVQVVAVSVSNLEEDQLPAMKEHAQARKFNFPYLHDPTQKIGRDYGASVTPQVFLLDGKRRVAYMGAWDDNALSPSEVQVRYLHDAIESVLAGTMPATGETKAKGCGIRYE